MIRFQLRCGGGDAFEAWFRGNAEYDEQRDGGRIACPFCGSSAIDKALMAPAVLSQPRKDAAADPAATVPAATVEPAAAPPVANQQIRLAAGDPAMAKAFEMMREIGRHVRANSDYVGPRFAEEARKIHYAEVPPRSIYGEASPAEVQGLAEEGVGFQPLPILPEERN